MTITPKTSLSVAFLPTVHVLFSVKRGLVDPHAWLGVKEGDWGKRVFTIRGYSVHHVEWSLLAFSGPRHYSRNIKWCVLRNEHLLFVHLLSGCGVIGYIYKYGCFFVGELIVVFASTEKQMLVCEVSNVMPLIEK